MCPSSDCWSGAPTPLFVGSSSTQAMAPVPLLPGPGMDCAGVKRNVLLLLGGFPSKQGPGWFSSTGQGEGGKSCRTSGSISYGICPSSAATPFAVLSAAVKRCSSAPRMQISICIVFMLTQQGIYRWGIKGWDGWRSKTNRHLSSLFETHVQGVDKVKFYNRCVSR